VRLSGGRFKIKGSVFFVPRTARCGSHCHRMVVEVKNINVLGRGRANSEGSLSAAGQLGLWVPPLCWGAPELPSPRNWGKHGGQPCCLCSVCSRPLLERALWALEAVGLSRYI